MICSMNILQPSMVRCNISDCCCGIRVQRHLRMPGQLYETFHEVCVQRNLLEEENKHELCFAEAVDSSMYSPHQLRSLLVVLIMDGAPAATILNKWEQFLIADYVESRSKENAHRALLKYIEDCLYYCGMHVNNWAFLLLARSRSFELE